MPSRRSAPRLPQSKVEIMGSRTPVDDRHAEIPASLADTVIGDDTAQEIGLLRPWKQHPKGASHRALLAPESTP